ncbi:phytanoyl-CoA dioxygenase domain-containing protein 1 homolog [Dendroctonus ponderosae]|uniref:Fe2OG dioxygenase domain-containing protein n=1 Tax=Dendroctonus ponderosae TaxID=77166 RepID=J3JU81_DENPD|nr:phytanoyl-CoA dioxygenase domain-containing protein 1 homolog [Dendroctonus ponderosae]AEE61756.1 unknown [Dendroctonus ponderosae]
MKDNIKKTLENDGFVVIEDFLSEKEVEEMKEEAGNLIKSMPERSKRTVFSTKDAENQQNRDKYFLDSANNISYFFEAGALDGEGNLLVDSKVSLNKIGHALHSLIPVFRKVSLSEKVKECAFQLGFQDPAICQSMYIFKNPGIGSEVIRHQDAWYLYTEPMSLVGFWFALEDATLQNGCLWFSKGSHKSGVHRRYIRNADKNSPELLIYNSPTPSYQTSNFNSVPVPKGSLVLIHGQVVHFSEQNKSEKSRHAYTFHIIEQKDAKYSEENWLQPPPEGFLSLYKH